MFIGFSQTYPAIFGQFFVFRMFPRMFHEPFTQAQGSPDPMEIPGCSPRGISCFSIWKSAAWRMFSEWMKEWYSMYLISKLLVDLCIDWVFVYRFIYLLNDLFIWDLFIDWFLYFWIYLLFIYIYIYLQMSIVKIMKTRFGQII